MKQIILWRNLHMSVLMPCLTVVGSGTHQMKGIEFYKDCPIFYCLGNFIFENEFVRDLPADYMENTGCRNLHPGQKELQKEVLRQRKLCIRYRKFIRRLFRILRL